MKEYKPLFDGDIVYLIPLGEVPPSHVILVDNQVEAHNLKLSLGLGKKPSPNTDTTGYELLAQKYGDAPVYKVLANSPAMAAPKPQEDWKDPGCCESGCKGCSWTKINMPDRY